MAQRPRGGRSGRGGGAGNYLSPREERERDLFGAPGEWNARKGAGREKSPLYSDENREADEFSPKVWRAEAAGRKGGSFFAKSGSFGALGATEEVQAALRACGVERPSNVQAAGFAPILAGNDVALADQTGSGKTLAYLTPIIQALRTSEASSGRTPAGHVRALVITPTSELAQQVLSVAKALSLGGAPFRSTIVTGEHKWRTQAKCAERGMELLVCTPGRLRAHLLAEPEPSFSLSLTTHVVLDEADLLFEDEDFGETWRVLREALPDTAGTSFVTATLPQWLITRVQEELPLTKLLRGESLHRTAAGVQEKLIDCSAGERVRGDGEAGFALKAKALTKELEDSPSDRVMVFCNTIESCRRVENYLRRRDRRGEQYGVDAFHGAIPAEQRKQTLKGFTAPASRGYEPPRILVCTDRASRGMDFHEVSHVILFDFPRDGVEYVRRVGRATRGDREPGRVTSLVLGRQLAYARELLKINREGGAVDLDVHGGGGDS
jgi:ATP-dependent RNA helicase DDX18/HAS1